MTSIPPSRRDVLKGAVAIAAASAATIRGPQQAHAQGGAMQGRARIDGVLRQATDAKEVPGVVAMAATDKGLFYEGAFGTRDLAAFGELVKPGLEQALKGERNAGLTRREMEILQFICDGKSNKEIAAKLDLSANTIAVHRANIMDALGIHKTAELVREINRTKALIVVEHDMQFIRMIAKQVTVFNQGSVLVEDAMENIMCNPQVRDIYLGKQAAA